VREIRDALAAIYGPVPFLEVTEYLGDLETIGILQREKAAHAP
jgi:predicted transcriptional regulator